MPTTEIANFERDTTAGAHLAARFGTGAGTAEQLIEANSLRFSDELIAANSLPIDQERTKSLDRTAIAEAVGVSAKNLLDYAARGSEFVTFVAQDSSGRTYKGVLLEEDGSFSAPEGDSGDPTRARIQAQAEANRIVAEAQAEAERIRAEAEAKAAEHVAKAAEEGQKKAADATQSAAKERQERSGRKAGTDRKADQRS